MQKEIQSWNVSISAYAASHDFPIWVANKDINYFLFSLQIRGTDLDQQVSVKRDNKTLMTFNLVVNKTMIINRFLFIFVVRMRKRVKQWACMREY